MSPLRSHAAIFLLGICACGGSVASSTPSAPSAEITTSQVLGACLAGGADAVGQLTLNVASPQHETWTTTASVVIHAYSKTATFTVTLDPGSLDVPAGTSILTMKLHAPSTASDNVCNCGDLKATATVTLDITTSSGALHVVGAPVFYSCAT